MAQAVRRTQELSIAREAQLMFRRAPTFTPVGSNLRRWRGKIKGGPRGKDEFLVEIIVPPNFPSQPPVARMLSPTKHPLSKYQGLKKLIPGLILLGLTQQGLKW